MVARRRPRGATSNIWILPERVLAAVLPRQLLLLQYPLVALLSPASRKRDDSHPTKKRGRPRKEVLRPPLSPIKARSPNIHRTATEHAIIPTNTAANCGILHWPKGVPFATPRCIGMVSGSYGAVLSYTVAAMRASSSKLESVVSSGSEKMLTAFSESEFSGSLDTQRPH